MECGRMEVAHFKMALEDEGGAMLRVQVTRREEKAAFAGELDGAVRKGRLLMNLRAEGEPEELAEIVSRELAKALTGIPHEMAEFACFKPGQSVPTHRVEALVQEGGTEVRGLERRRCKVIPAWGNAPGIPAQNAQGLKARPHS